MERRFDVRLEELLDDAVLDERIPQGMLERLKTFATPFAACLASSELQRHVWEYMSGLFSDVKRKNAETIAYFHDQDRQAMQKFIGQSPWDDRPLVVRTWSGKLARESANLTGCWFSIPRRSRSRERNRSALRDSGAVGWAKSTIVKSACIWVTSRAKSTPWPTCGCI